MPRRADITPRELVPDPVYGSPVVTQVINKVMLDGKRSTAERIVYGALTIVGEKTGREPVEVLEQAIKSVTPVLETRSRRVGGANYQVPVEVPQRRARTLAVRWLVTYARERREKGMSDKLANEILDALNQQGGIQGRPVQLDLRDDGYEPEQLQRKGQRNQQLLEAALRLRPDDAYLHYQLGKDHEVHDRYAEARPAYVRALDLLGPRAGRQPGWRHDLVLRALFTLKACGQAEAALDLAQQEQPHWPDSADFHFVLGDVLLDLAARHPEQASLCVPMIREAWQTCLRLGDTLTLGDRNFRVLTGDGHSAEQVMLYCEKDRLLFVADQVLERISPNVAVWVGVLAPAKTPAATVSRINQEAVRALRLPDIKEKLFVAGSEVMASTAEEATTIVRAELAKWGKVIKEAGIKAE